MDFLTPVGLIVGSGCVLLGLILEGGHIESLIQPTAFLIVICGSFGSLLVAFPLPQVMNGFIAMKDACGMPAHNVHTLVDQFVDFARKARADGILALEAEAEKIDDPFFKRAISLAVDGTAAGVLRSTLEAQMEAEEEKLGQCAKVYECWGMFAPTVGVLGAVLGLIHVMENLDKPESIGPGIAIAFVATVYGVGWANLIMLPLAANLKLKAQLKGACQKIIVEGIGAIQSGLPPSLVEEKLRGMTGSPRPGGAAKE